MSEKEVIGSVLDVFEYTPRLNSRQVSIRSGYGTWPPFVTYPRRMSLAAVREKVQRTAIFKQQYELFLNPVENPIDPNYQYFGCVFHFVTPSLLERRGHLEGSVARVVSEEPFDSFSSQYMAYMFLRQHLMRVGPDLLCRLVDGECARLGLDPPSQVRVRELRRVFGNCSSRRVITLSSHLLFYDPEYVRYTILHELAHLTFMDHSSDFWNLLSEYLGEDARAFESRFRQKPAKLAPRLFV